MADYQINNGVAYKGWHHGRRLVNVDGDTEYVFWTLGGAGGLGPYWSKSTDNGVTWSVEVDLSTTTMEITHFDCYYGKWNGSSHPNVVYMTWTDRYEGGVGPGELYFAAFSLDTDSLLIASTVVVDMAGGLGRGVSICRSESGNLYVTMRTHPAFGNATVLYKSTDNGATWASQTTTTNLNVYFRDSLMLWPDFSSADPDDFLALYWDQQNSIVSVKQVDVSSGVITTTQVATGVASPVDSVTDVHNWSATMTDAGVIYLVVGDVWNTSPTTMYAYTISGANVTAKTNVFTSTAYAYAPYLAIGSDGNVYCFYGRDPEGTSRETMAVYYKKSTDTMTTWGSEVRVSGDADYRVNLLVGDPRPGGSIRAVWFGALYDYYSAQDAVAMVNLSAALPMTFTLTGTLSGGITAAPPTVIKCKPIAVTQVVNFNVRIM